jgi:hypothetical protein
MSPSDLGVFVSAKRAAAADEAGDSCAVAGSVVDTNTDTDTRTDTHTHTQTHTHTRIHTHTCPALCQIARYNHTRIVSTLAETAGMCLRQSQCLLCASAPVSCVLVRTARATLCSDITVTTAACSFVVPDWILAMRSQKLAIFCSNCCVSICIEKRCPFLQCAWPMFATAPSFVGWPHFRLLLLHRTHVGLL